MAKKNLNGQLSMFDFFRNLENDVPQNGEVEMVSLMPDDIAVDEEEYSGDIAVDEEEHEHTSDIAMSYEIKSSDGNISDAVYYVNYNTVVIIEDGIKKTLEFDNSKEAVDCYIEYVLRKKKSK